MASRTHGNPQGILPHAAFLKKANVARLADFHYDPRTRVASRGAFVQMQDHLDRLYRDVDVVHSFEDSSGQIFDCIPIEQQPGRRSASGPMPTPPDMSRAPTMEGPGGRRSVLPQQPMLDRHGNERIAPPGTVPVRRVTLNELTRFRDLDSFFHKNPRREILAWTAPGPSAPSTNLQQNHRYAAGTQQVTNIGGASYLSIYQPTVHWPNEVFSLAQHWYSGGSDTGLQTVEVGWQVFPEKYGNANPNLFIYYTPDGYQSGSYNLDNTNTFVQMSQTFTIGGALQPVSVRGGEQRSLMIGVYMSHDAWWIYLNGYGNENLLGYYPTSLFGPGPMATGADTIVFGGETLSDAPPDGDWPPMGSGAEASDGWLQAAFHCYIYYWKPDGTAQWANLKQVDSSSCYGYSPGFDEGEGGWGTYLFFGGFGGADC